MQKPHDKIDTLLERLNASSADDELKAVVEALLQNYRSMTVFANNIFKRLSERDTIIAENKVGLITLVDFLVASRFFRMDDLEAHERSLMARLGGASGTDSSVEGQTFAFQEQESLTVKESNNASVNGL